MVNGFSLSGVRKEMVGFSLDAGWRTGGGFTVLFGYSGAGKSLTLSALTGALKPDAGSITFGNQVLLDAAHGIHVPPQDREFGYVSQSAELFPHLTVAQNVAFGLHRLPRAARPRRVEQMLDAFKLEDLARKRPAQLSGGQKQRAALARALAPRPRALLLDEPLSALDLPVRVEMRELLRQVQRSHNIPVVMVTHDLYEAATLADSLVVYGGDGVIQTGSVAELIADPGTPAIRRLLHAMELPESLFAPRITDVTAA